MKRFVAVLSLISVLLVFTSCGNNEEKDSAETTSSVAAVEGVYENVAFANLKTFTEITGIALNNTIEDNTDTTTFCYVVFEDAQQKITDYKTYLSDSGYKMTSSVDSEKIVFESEGKEIVITYENGSSGTNISITIPCDEKTNNVRKEKVYNEILAAAEKKDFKEVFKITDRFSSDEISSYKDVKAYRLFSIAMEAYDDKIYGTAHEYFTEYLEEDTADKLGAANYIKECDGKLKKYNGTYAGTSYNGLIPYLMYIKDGKVALEMNTDKLMGSGNASKPDSVYYLNDLKIEEVDGTVLLDIVTYMSGNVEYKYDLTLLDNGNILVNDFAWDVLKGYQNDPATFAGEYKKISSETPAAK